MTTRTTTATNLLPGLVVVAGLAAVASILGRLVPLVGAPVFGILAGVATGAVLRNRSRVEPGAAVAGKVLLQASVVLLGTGLSLHQVLDVGAASVPVMLGTLAVALGGAWLIGSALGVDRATRLLVGVGTGICGASAIAAVAAVAEPAREKVAQAIGTIFTFNIAAVLLFPALGHLLGLSQDAFGMWAGTAVNDTSSVVATAYAYGDAAGDRAVVVKLTRALMIVPICLALVGVLTARRRARTRPAPTRAPFDPLSLVRALPLFIVGFLAASLLQTLGLIPEQWGPVLSSAGIFLMTMALAGIGLNTRLANFRSAGWAPLALGAILFVLVGATSLALQWASGTL